MSEVLNSFWKVKASVGRSSVKKSVKVRAPRKRVTDKSLPVMPWGRAARRSSSLMSS